MAASKGYQCEFIDSIREDFYCKRCALVAWELTIADCCGESFCQTCIAGTKELGQPCPVCEEKGFAIIKHVKNRKIIKCLQVYCSMKERGCVWSGTLDQLDTHLDPHLDNCQYVDTKCPLNCLQSIPKNKVPQHVAQECSKRPHVCQHCGFKATYEDVIDTHMLECKYVPLQCPNMCGVSCDREVIEDHMKICRLEEVECEFCSVGCDGRFIREDQDEHSRQNSLKHLSLTAFLAVETKEQLLHKLVEQDKKRKEVEEKLEMKIEGQEKKLGEQEKKLGEQEKKLGEQEKKLGEQEKKLGEQEKKLGEQEKKLREQQKTLGEQGKILGEQNIRLNKKIDRLDKMLKKQYKTVTELTEFRKESETKIFDFTNILGMNRTFEMGNFSLEKAKNKVSDWKSPPMYTHANGYKFCIGVDANGCDSGLGNSVRVDLWSMPGEFDDQLVWPADVKVTIELINKKGGENAKCTCKFGQDGPVTTVKYRSAFSRIANGLGFIGHSELKDFLVDDTLYFNISEIKLL